MEIVATNMTVADYCQALVRREITVNRQYQRSDKVWPTAARSFLIETILLGFPMPKLSLHQVTDLRTRSTHKEIVDGQQRTEAISAFFNNELRLSTTLELEEAAGKQYGQLAEELQAKFMDYRLSMDLFVGAAPEEVREVFRRINSYTVPLNPEEQRHASHQGPFKWFVRRLARDFGESFLKMEVFRERQLVRMADAKLITEISHALLHGISTTNKPKLDQLYKSRDGSFAEERVFDRRFRGAMDVMASLTEIHGTELMKPYQVYALLLAIMHLHDPVESLQGVARATARHRLNRERAIANLTVLADAVEQDAEAGDYGAFVRASATRTNVADQRSTRFRWLYGALTENMPG